MLARQRRRRERLKNNWDNCSTLDAWLELLRGEGEGRLGAVSFAGLEKG